MSSLVDRRASAAGGLALLLSLLLAAPASALAQPPGETPTPDAPPGADVGGSAGPADSRPAPPDPAPAKAAKPTDAGPEGKAAAADALETRRTALQQRKQEYEAELAALEGLVEHQLGDTPALTEFFTIDLADDAAVELAKEKIEAQIEALESRRAAKEALPAKIDDAASASAGDATGTTGDATGTTGDVTGDATGTTGTTGDATTTTDNSATTTAAEPEPEPEPEPELDPLHDLQETVDALEAQVLSTRLAILRLPLAERERIAFEEEERRRSDELQAAAQSTAVAAVEEARVAEAARQRALEAATAARTAIQRKVAQERAAAEGIRRDQAQLRGRLANTRHEFETQRKAGEWPGHGLALDAEDIKPQSAASSLLYDRIVEALDEIRIALEAALVNAENDPEIPRYTPDLPNPPSDAPPTIISDIKALERTAVELDAAADELDKVARTLAFDVLEATFEHESELYEARIALLDKLPKDKYDAVLGLGREGIAQLQREFRRLFLATRWYRLQREGAPRRFLHELGDIYAVAHYTSILTWLLVIIGLTIYGIRHGSRHLESLRTLVVRTIKRASLIRLLQGLFDALDALLLPILHLVAVLLIWPALAELQDVPEFAAIYNILFYVAVYRLCLRAAHVGIARLINRHITPEVSAKILRSLQLIGRTALTIAIFLAISERILGKGYLYRLVLGFAWIGALPIAAILIRWWRQTIADAYLKFSGGSGAMADAVRKTRGKWYGFFVTTAAVSILFVVAVIRFARQFVLGFEQSRKALAFVFRRRLERQAEDLDDARPRILPQDLVDHLATTACDAGPLRLDYFPGLDEWAEEYGSWRHSTTVGSTLVVSRPGLGKTTWLRAARERATQAVQCEIAEIDLGSRVLTRHELLAVLAESLRAPPEARTSLEALRDWLLAGSRRLVTIDNLHSLFLRGVDTNRAWDALDDLIAETGRKVYWLATVDYQPYEFLCWAYRGRGSFRKVIELPPWPEERIAELLRRRTAAAEFEVVYDDLVIDRVEGVQAQAQLVGTELEYARLLWDYADGSPAVALDCWRASLVSDGERCVRVRLFRRPQEILLESLDEPKRFLLASVLWHSHLSAEEAVLSLRYRPDLCSEGLDHLAEWGVLASHDGHFMTTIPWRPAIYRYLRRHHLLED